MSFDPARRTGPPVDRGAELQHAVGALAERLREAPARDVRERQLERIIAEARGATAASAQRRTLLPLPSSRRARAAISVGAIVVGLPATAAGLAVAGVSLPGPAVSAFQAIGVTLPNQGPGEDEQPRPSKPGESARGDRDGGSDASGAGSSAATRPDGAAAGSSSQRHPTGTPAGQHSPGGPQAGGGASGPGGPPDSTPSGPPDGTPSGPPQGTPSGPPEGTPSGPPQGTPSGPPDGTPSGPPQGMSSGPSADLPSGPSAEPATGPPEGIRSRSSSGGPGGESRGGADDPGRANG